MGVFTQLAKYINKAVISEAPLYFYRSYNPSGVSSVTSKSPVGAMERSLIFIERYSSALDWVPETMPVILKKAVWFGISAYTWFNRENAEKYSEGYGKIQKFFVDHKADIAKSQLIDKPRKLAAKFIISNFTFPFTLISWLRPAMKKIINTIQGTARKS